MFGIQPKKTSVNYEKADIWGMGILVYYMLER